MTVYTCQYWADQRKLSKEQLAAHIVNLAWYGLSRMEAKPELRYESEKAMRDAEKQAAKEAKENAKRERKAAKSQDASSQSDSPNNPDDPGNNGETDEPAQSQEQQEQQPNVDEN